MLCCDLLALLWSNSVHFLIELFFNMTVKGGTTPACAACKYQRRRCVPTCPLAPYFPANQAKTFQNVHRLFGVSNVTKTLKGLQTDVQREDAMKSIIFEADMRERYPVHGCSAIIFQLKFQIHYAFEELKCLYAQLAKCREQVNKQVVDPWTNQQELTTYSAESMQVFYNNQSTTDAPPYVVNESNGFYGDSFDNMSKQMVGLEQFDGVNDNNNNSNNLVSLQAQMDALGIQGRQTLINQEYEGIPFNMMDDDDDDRQSYIQTTMEPCESCSESPQMDSNMSSVRQVCKNELRNAAAGFSLTTVN